MDFSSGWSTLMSVGCTHTHTHTHLYEKQTSITQLSLPCLSEQKWDSRGKCVYVRERQRQRQREREREREYSKEREHEHQTERERKAPCFSFCQNNGREHVLTPGCLCSPAAERELPAGPQKQSFPAASTALMLYQTRQDWVWSLGSVTCSYTP